ncbi:zinc-dependent metalloprotease [Gemmata sp. JC673]|uniref:Zinc-dependent metalloprotease n=1 Tax=Gemmata algarum TaxID=2975278 RepID=A0ABU5F2D9_9BACT|nr:zinc-dependent metalloprotease [Gemmata algarum]MDY3560278.1 zinc-dependent metalloprotease [Gemmata algarum]
MRTRLASAGFVAALALLTSRADTAGAKQPAPPPRSVSKLGDLKKYDDVITKDFTTSPGVFAVHRHEDKLYFEIPQDKQGRLLLWRAEVAKGPGGGMGGSWGGADLGHTVLKFERRGNKMYLWKVGFSKRSDGKAVQAAIDASATDAIVAVFNVECEGKDRAAVVNVSDTFILGLTDLPITRAAGVSGASVDSSRSYLSEVKAFPSNIEARATITFRASGGGSPFGVPGLGGGARSVTALVHHSLVLLPETPMQGRLFDPRVGYFTEEFADYAHPKNWAVSREYITRFRLEKKNPNDAVSEVVKPITFYLSKEIPEKWRSYMKQGVEDWAPAFEKAGFKNAIVCRDVPTRAEDPNFDPEDARHSVIRWVAEPVQNAMGPHVHDPRSGEVISAHIIFWHDIVKTCQTWYFVQCSAVDPKARKFPLPDETTGAMMRYVCAHEVGHTIGLRHNHRASQAYSVSQLRDPKFCAEHGSVASIMSYGRCNYVAQPEDKVDPKHLLPKLAPYDYFAIEWGYKPIPSAKTPDEERKTLDEWAAKQLTNPFLRFGGEDGPSSVDPTVLTENIGSDPVQVTALGLKNLDRVAGHLLAATTEKGEDYSLLEEVYGDMLQARLGWFGAVAKQVGGVVESRTLGGRGGEAFSRVPKEKQKEAVKFLLDHAFTTPTKLLAPGLVNQFKFSGTGSDISNQQRLLLRSLLSPVRLARLTDAELLAPEKAYTAAELVADIQDGVFSELKADVPKIDPLRRQLQRTYLDTLKAEFAPPAAAATPSIPGLSTGPAGPRPASELRAVARQSLAKLGEQLEAAEGKAKDPLTVAHIADLRSEIAALLAADKKK